MTTFYFHGSLNDFLRKDRKNVRFSLAVTDRNAIKDTIEALGIPHPEVAGIKVNNNWVGFGYAPAPEDEVEVFPAEYEESIPVESRLRPP
jgi:uncharacterized protein